VTGHADRVGTSTANLRLSRRRAEAIKEGLVQRGVAAARIRTEAFGEDRPIVETTDGVPEAQNRLGTIFMDESAEPCVNRRV
jgi:outer membrane protein OmpA-like peptidoglycan-associated protein